MTQQIKYGIEMPNPNSAMPFVDMPKPFFDQLVKEKVIIPPATKMAAKKLCAVIAELPDDINRVTVMTRRIGRLHPDRKEVVCRAAINLFDIVGSRSVALGMADPNLSLKVSSKRLFDDSRLGLSAEIQWSKPEIPDGRLSAVVTDVMRTVAIDTKYASDTRDMSRRQRSKFIDGLVSAQIDRGHGVTLETNGMGSSLDTDGVFYRPDKPSVRLDAHNVYSHEQQVMLLSGAIALAHAPELLQSQAQSVKLTE